MGKGKVDAGPAKMKDFLAKAAEAAKKKSAEAEKRRQDSTPHAEDAQASKRQKTSGGSGKAPADQDAQQTSQTQANQPKRTKATVRRGGDKPKSPSKDSHVVTTRPGTPFVRPGSSSAAGGDTPPPW